MKQKHKVQMVALAHATEECINRSPLKNTKLDPKATSFSTEYPNFINHNHTFS